MRPLDLSGYVGVKQVQAKQHLACRCLHLKVLAGKSLSGCISVAPPFSPSRVKFEEFNTLISLHWTWSFNFSSHKWSVTASGWADRQNVPRCKRWIWKGCPGQAYLGLGQGYLGVTGFRSGVSLFIWTLVTCLLVSLGLFLVVSWPRTQVFMGLCQAKRGVFGSRKFFFWMYLVGDLHMHIW